MLVNTAHERNNKYRGFMDKNLKKSIISRVYFS